MKGLKTYCEKTTFHGFGWIAIASSWIMWLFWLAAILTSIGFAAWDLQQLIVVYQSEPTTTFVSSQSNDSLYFDGITISIEFLQYAQSDPMNSANVTQSLSAELDAQINLFRSDATTVPKISDSLLQVIFNTIRACHVGESSMFESPNNSTGQYKYDVVSYAVYDYFWKRNVTMKDVSRVFPLILCSKMRIDFLQKLQKYDYSMMGVRMVNISLCEYKYVVFFDTKVVIGTNNFGYLTTVTFRSPPVNITEYDTVIVRFDTPATLNKLRTASEDQLVNIDLQLRSNVSLKDNTIQIWFNATEHSCAANIVLMVSGLYSFSNLNRRPCTTLAENVKCQQMCYAMKIFESCNCWPTTYSSIKPKRYVNSTDCGKLALNQSAFVQSLGFKEVRLPGCNRMNQDSTTCANNCPGSCDAIVYDTTPYSSSLVQGPCDLRGGGLTGDQIISFNSARFTFPVYEEQTTMDWHVFIGSFGGSMGIWLGGSFLAVIHVPVYFLSFVFLSCCSRKSKHVAVGTDD